VKTQAELFEVPEIVIILDACRYDKFMKVKQELDIQGETIPVWSPAHQTADWYKYYWSKKQDKNRILVSGTPVPWRHKWVGDLIKNFGKAIPVWKDVEHYNKLDMVSVDYTMHVANKQKTVNQDKTLLIHHLPPHLPMYGDRGHKWTLNEVGEDKINIYIHAVNYGKHNGWKTIQEYYNESIEKALKEILKHEWINDYHTVITADHGEFIGEGNQYGHSGYNPNAEQLRVVPWHTVSEGKQ